jgi:hypothetical protein
VAQTIDTLVLQLGPAEEPFLGLALLRVRTTVLRVT